MLAHRFSVAGRRRVDLDRLGHGVLLGRRYVAVVDVRLDSRSEGFGRNSAIDPHQDVDVSPPDRAIAADSDVLPPSVTEILSKLFNDVVERLFDGLGLVDRGHAGVPCGGQHGH